MTEMFLSAIITGFGWSLKKKKRESLKKPGVFVEAWKCRGKWHFCPRTWNV